MAIDLNQEEEQKALNYGPVPAKSVVMVRMSVQKAQYASKNHEYVSRAQSGLMSLWCKFTVIRGEYEGVSWHENLNLPVGQQGIALTDGQTTACKISGRKIRAITEAHRGINPKDESDRARRARDLHDWLDLNDMEFPARLEIGKESYTGKDGKERWSNVLGMIITPDRKEYALLKQGKEIITDGAVIGQSTGKPRSNGNNRTAFGDDEYDDLGPSFPSEASSMDDVPFNPEG